MCRTAFTLETIQWEQPVRYGTVFSLSLPAHTQTHTPNACVSAGEVSSVGCHTINLGYRAGASPLRLLRDLWTQSQLYFWWIFSFISSPPSHHQHHGLSFKISCQGTRFFYIFSFIFGPDANKAWAQGFKNREKMEKKDGKQRIKTSRKLLWGGCIYLLHTKGG